MASDHATPRRPLLAVDAPYVLYRSFFALPDSIKGADGRPVNALLGAVNILLRIAADRDPRAIVACFGAEAAAYRVELYPPYHAQRPPVPDDLAWQFEQAPGFFAAFGWSSESSDGLEADDLLGSLGDVEEAAGGTALIVTGDRDMYQCAGEPSTCCCSSRARSGSRSRAPPRCSAATGSRRRSCPTSSPCAATRPMGCRAPPASAPRPRPSCSTRYGSLEAAIARRAQRAPEDRRRAHRQRRRAAGISRIATLQPADVERPPDRATDLKGGAAAARELGLSRLAERLEAAQDIGDL